MTTYSREIVTLRNYQIGDIGWIIYRHAKLYEEEYGWNEQFEALVADVAAKFLKEHDESRERCWIAEIGGEFAGCIFVVDAGDNIAKLRLLLVEPSARGKGVGRKLIAECLDVALKAGYQRITLWTNDVLLAARHLYETFGFRLVEEEPNELFGPKTVAQTWEKEL